MSKKSKVKDKPFKKQTMEEFIHEKAEDLSYPIIQDTTHNAKLINMNTNQKNTAEAVEKDSIVKMAYNSNIKNLDPLYASLEPTQGILVRVYAKLPTRTQSGLFIENPVKVPVMTQNGRGILSYAISPYPVTDRAVIVALPSGFYGFEVGDIVQLGDIPVVCPLPGDSTVIPKFAYKHPDANTDVIPTNVEDSDYGYYLVPPALIIAFLEKMPRPELTKEEF